MKSREFKALADGELKDKLNELARQLMKDRAQVAQGTAIKSPGKIRAARRAIARIKMMLHQKANAPKPALPAKAPAPSPKALVGRKPEAPKKA